MEVTLSNIEINQFKGIKHLVLEFSHNNTLFGTNKVGKTTVANAITWCLFGKDIYDRKDYQIMPLDGNNEMIPQMEPTVILNLLVDGNKKVFKRVMSQKWVKKRGDSESTFDGSCTTSYSVDQVPIKQKEYNDIVNSIIEEKLFRVITLPAHFPSLDWKVSREMIISIVGDVDIDNIKSRDEFIKLVEHMEGKSVDDYRKMISFQKKAIQRDLDQIPGKIKGAEDLIPDELPNFKEIVELIGEKKTEIKAIENQISDKSSVLNTFQEELQKRAQIISSLEAKKNEFVNSFISDKNDKQQSLSNDKRKIDQQIITKENDIEDVKSKIAQKQREISRLEEEKRSLETTRNNNKGLYISLKDKTFEAPEDSNCPVCKQAIIISDESLVKMEEEFNNDKANKLSTILTNNQPLIKRCDEIDSLIDKTKEAIRIHLEDIRVLEEVVLKLKDESKQFISAIAALNISGAKIKATEHPDYLGINKEIEDIKSKSSEAPKVDVSEFTSKKDALLKEVEDLQRQYNKMESIDQANANILRYNKEGKELSRQLTELEGYEYSTELFEKAIAEDVEKRVNSRLENGVTFKMFHKQNNEGIRPTCEILIDGVPYNSANTGSQIMAGITIINLLCDHYNTYAPIIIDNRESVVEIPETKSQTINLVVDKSVKTLTLK